MSDAMPQRAKRESLYGDPAAPITVDGRDLHDASIELDNGYWRCKLCRRQATGMAQPRGRGIIHRGDCFLVESGVIKALNLDERARRRDGGDG